MATPTTTGLRGLANNVPVANQRLAAQQKAARDIQLQQAVRNAPTTTLTAPSAQQTGAALAANAGQQQVANQAAAGQVNSEVANLGQQVKALQSQQTLGDAEAGAREQEMSNAQRLAAVSEQAKREIYDARRKFDQDEMGRKFTNERQLADYKRLRARTDSEWQDYVQKSELAANRNLAMLDIGFQRISQQLEITNQRLQQAQEQANNLNISRQERATGQDIARRAAAEKARLEAAATALQRQMASSQAKAANRKMMHQAVGVLGGALAAGAIVATGGAAAPAVLAAASGGASLGGAAGSLIP